MFPEVSFHLTDSIGKKIKVVQAVVDELGLRNVKAEKIRAEDVDQTYDFVVSRAVANMTDFVKIVNDKISPINNHPFKNGILYLKGGDLSSELKSFKSVKTFNISDYFNDSFFETKKIVYLPNPYKGKGTQ